MRIISSYFLYMILFVSCTTTKTIIEHPITFNDERKILTLEYLENRYGLEQDSPQIVPKMIVFNFLMDF